MTGRRNRMRRERRRPAENENDTALDIIRFLVCIVLTWICIILIFMIRTWHFTGFSDESLTPKPRPYKETVNITAEESPKEYNYQTLYYLYTARPDGTLTSDMYSKDGTILVRFDEKAMYLCYGWAGTDSPLTYSLLTDGTYCRYDSYVKSWQERAVVRTEIGRIYIVMDKGGKKNVLAFSTAKEDTSMEKEDGDDIVRSFYEND